MLPLFFPLSTTSSSPLVSTLIFCVFLQLFILLFYFIFLPSSSYFLRFLFSYLFQLPLLHLFSLPYYFVSFCTCLFPCSLSSFSLLPSTYFLCFLSSFPLSASPSFSIVPRRFPPPPLRSLPPTPSLPPTIAKIAHRYKKSLIFQVVIFFAFIRCIASLREPIFRGSLESKQYGESCSFSA